MIRVPANAWLIDRLPTTRPVVLWSAPLPATDGQIVVPASLTTDADPDRPEQWRPLELAPLRVEDAARHSQVAWFSFQPRPAKPERIATLLAKRALTRLRGLEGVTLRNPLEINAATSKVGTTTR
jgi:hypothetical protein